MPLTKNEQDSTTDESLLQDSDVNNELSSDESESGESDSKQNFFKDASLLEEPGRESEASAAESAVVIKPRPSCETQNPLPPASHLKIPKELPLPKLKRLSSPHISRYFRDDFPTEYVQVHLPQKPQLEPHLKIFSPQRLTSALLKVNRNYDYILSKPGNLKEYKEQRTAYDLEIVL